MSNIESLKARAEELRQKYEWYMDEANCISGDMMEGGKYLHAANQIKPELEALEAQLEKINED